MTTHLKKLFVVALITTLVVPAAFFAFPPKTVHAGGGVGSCVGSLLGGAGALGGAAADMMGVPVRNVGITTNTGVTAGMTTGSNLKECVLDVLVSIMAQTLINNLTASIVQWINSGFQGSPSFVTDPEGFFADVGDQAAGMFISQLGDVGKILCSPFDLQIRIALGLGFDANLKQYTGCRLSDVQRNVYNAFTGGQWGKDGWSNFISVSQPQNNAYGAYLYSSDALNRTILKNVSEKDRQLLQGRGFLSYEQCDAWSEGPDQGSGEGGQRICLHKSIKTPGSVIETQLNNTLFSGVRRVEVADNINAIFSALANQAVMQIFKGGSGLLGMSSGSSSYGGKSYVQNLVTSYQSQTQTAKAKPPAGIQCTNPTTKQQNVFNITDQGVVQTITQGRWDRDSNGVLKYPKVCVAAGNLLSWEHLECSAYTDYTVNGKVLTVSQYPPGSGNDLQQSIAVFDKQIQDGCLNAPIDVAANQGISDALSQGNVEGFGTQSGTGTGVPGTDQLQNLAMGGTVTQNGVAPGFVDQSTAGKAIDGIKNYQSILVPGSGMPVLAGNALTSGSSGGTNEWWQVRFKPSTVKSIKIYPTHYTADSNDFFTNESKANFIVELLNDQGGVVKTFDVTGGFAANGWKNVALTGDVSGWIKDGLSTNASGLRVTLKSSWYSITSRNYLALDEVEVSGTTGTGAIDQGPGTPTTSEVHFSTMPSPLPTANLSPSDPASGHGSQFMTRIFLTSPAPIPYLHVTAHLLRVVNGTQTIPVTNTASIFAPYDNTVPAFLIKRYLQKDQMETSKELIYSTANSNNGSLEKLTNSGFDEQPFPATNSYYLDFVANLSDSSTLNLAGDGYGTYQLVIDITERDDPTKIVGQIIHPLNIIPSTTY